MEDIIHKGHIMQPTVIQTAEKSVYIESKENATVNLTINIPQGMQIGTFLPNGSANDTPTIQGLSHEYYNLIVFDDPDIELPANTAWVSESRSPYNSEHWIPDEIKKNGYSDDRIIKKELLKIPALICYENTDYHYKTSPKHKATLAYLTDVERKEKTLYFYFKPICLFYQQLINKNLEVFGLSGSKKDAIGELNRSHWAIKERNIFEALQKVGVAVPEIKA